MVADEHEIGGTWLQRGRHWVFENNQRVFECDGTIQSSVTIGGRGSRLRTTLFIVEHTNTRTQNRCKYFFQSKETENGMKQFTLLRFSVLSALLVKLYFPKPIALRRKPSTEWTAKKHIFYFKFLATRALKTNCRETHELTLPPFQRVHSLQ